MNFHDSVALETFGRKIDNLLKKLQAVVDKAIGIAHHEIDVAEGAVNTASAKVESVAKNALNGLQKVFIRKIDALKDKAKRSGVNIDSCLGRDEISLLNLPTRAAKEAVKCVQVDVDRVFNRANDVLNRVSDLLHI